MGTVKELHAFQSLPLGFVSHGAAIVALPVSPAVQKRAPHAHDLLGLRVGERPEEQRVERGAGIICGMSLAELKQQVDQLTPAEKNELLEYLDSRPIFGRARKIKAASDAMLEMDAGRKYSRADVEKIDRELTERGQ